MGIPLHSKIRKKLRTVLNKSLSMFTNQQSSEPINPSDIKKVLLIRINYRIGNIIFMTPLIRALEKKLPHAKVDMMVGAPFTAPIIKEMPSIENVYAMPRETTKNPIKLFKEIRKINQNNYDLVINPITGSVSTNIATLLIKAKLKLGFYKPDTWMPINRSVADPKDISHEALKPLALMDIFSGEILSYNQYLDIAISQKERDEGREIISDLIDNKTDAKIIGIFRDARNEKKIENDWWITFIKQMGELDQSAIFIDILPPNEKEALLPDMAFVSSKNLRDLAKIFAALDLFICGDTGPMHLASASLTPVVAFFNATDPSLYGPLGKKDRTIQINDKDISLIVNEIYTHISKYL